MTTTKEYINDAMTAMLEGDSDRALGLLLRASLAYDDDISKASAAMEPAIRDLALPPIKPINGKAKAPADFDYQPFEPAQGRLRNDSPSLVPCPVCGAPKGHLCVQVIGENVGELLTGKQRPDAAPSPSWHDQRRDKARAKRKEKS